jgi:hypothetical protein
MSSDRRRSPRTRVDLFINKYIDGYPHLCRAIEVSDGGVLVERVNEPEIEREFYPVEIGVMEVEGERAPERIWLWARQVWRDGARQALRFVGAEEHDVERLRRVLSRASEIVAPA